jgi:hypothetical protein
MAKRARARKKDRKLVELLVEQPVREPYQFVLDDSDGDTVRRFKPDGPCEVWIVWKPVDPESKENEVVLPLGFPSYELAERAVRMLRPSLAAVSRTLERATGLAEHAPAAVDDGHRHRVVLERISRSLPLRAVCADCMVVLRDKIKPSELTAEERADHETLKEAIEAEANG